MKNSTSLHSVLCVLIFLAAHLPATAEAQSFRHYIPLESKDGKTIQAEIIYFTSSTVMARRADGLMFEMPPQRLTPATLQRILAYPAAKASAEAEAAKLYPPFVGSGLPVRPSVVGTTDEERKFAELWKEKAVTMTGDGLVALMRSDDAGGYLPHIKAGLSPWIVFLSNDINSMKGPPNNCIRGSIVDVSLGIGDLVEGGKPAHWGCPNAIQPGASDLDHGREIPQAVSPHQARPSS